MKAYALALFLLMIQVSAAIVNTSDVFDERPIVIDDHYLNSTKDQLNATLEDGGATSSSSDYERSVIGKFTDFAGNVFQVKKTLVDFGVPENLALYISIPVYMVWLVAVIQFFWRKDISTMA